MFRHARMTIFLSHMDFNHGPTLVCGPPFSQPETINIGPSGVHLQSLLSHTVSVAFFTLVKLKV